MYPRLDPTFRFGFPASLPAMLFVTLVLPCTLLSLARPAAAICVTLGAAHADTLAAEPAAVHAAALKAMAEEGWLCPLAPTASDSLVTDWKPMRSLFVRLFAGDVKARCVVAINPLGPGRTVVVFRAMVATPQDMSASPLRARAERAYSGSAARWFQKVRHILASVTALRPSLPALTATGHCER